MNDRKRQVLAKIKRLHLSKRNSLNFQISGVRYDGVQMSDISFDEEVIKFSYRSKKYIICISDISKMRRLRVRKWLFIVEGLKEQKKQVKTSPKKEEKKEIKSVKIKK